MISPQSWTATILSTRTLPVLSTSTETSAISMPATLASVQAVLLRGLPPSYLHLLGAHGPAIRGASPTSFHVQTVFLDRGGLAVLRGGADSRRRHSCFSATLSKIFHSTFSRPAQRSGPVTPPIGRASAQRARSNGSLLEPIVHLDHRQGGMPRSRRA